MILVLFGVNVWATLGATVILVVLAVIVASFFHGVWRGWRE
jgi:hypothetical protein